VAMQLVVQLAIALGIFLGLNWVGRHSAHLGYETPSLFDSANGSIALNFVIRSFAPTVIMIVTASAFIKAGFPHLTDNIYRAIIGYFLIRVGYVILWNRSQIVSWPKITFQCAVGIGSAVWAYDSLIVPRNPLFPDVNTIGNELWLAIAAFVYAMVNGIEAPSEPSTRRANSYITKNFSQIKIQYGHLIVGKMQHRALELAFFSLLIFENYNRPKFTRFLERVLPTTKAKTYGIAQVKADEPITDIQSVERAQLILNENYTAFLKNDPSLDGKWELVRDVIVSYNKDSDYAGNIYDIMDIISARIDESYRPEFKLMWDE
jgi:hypothetical protein